MSEPLFIFNARLVTPSGILDDAWLLARDGKIVSLGQGEPRSRRRFAVVNAHNLLVLPGFIDVHVHGGAGHEAMDAAPDALRGMAQFYARHGVTSFLATTWTDTRERITAALETIAAMTGQIENGATLLGAHVEGPYLNPDKCGAQNLSYIRRADRDEALAWLNLGVIKLLALAPEYPENHWLIEECARRGIVVSAAHTAATYEQVCYAVNLGLRQATHTYNAMTPLLHREPGTVGAVMALDAINCELIADTIHVHPVAMDILARVKGFDRVILITDAIRGAGMPDGDYPVDERIITIRDGAARLPDGTLAGSTLTMERALHNFMQAAGQPLVAVWRCSSLNAARALGIDRHKGSIEPGKDADLALVDDRLNVHLTIAEGRIVYHPTQ